jgi:hypothetical protein
VYGALSAPETQVEFTSAGLYLYAVGTVLLIEVGVPIAREVGKGGRKGVRRWFKRRGL